MLRPAALLSTLLLAEVAPACIHDVHDVHGAGARSARAASSTADPLERVASIHGGAGPWAVAGYRMGEYALEQFALTRGSRDLLVTHRSPREVQYSCVIDGASAATGASVGKLNLSHEEAPVAEMVTVFTNRRTHASLTLRLTDSFRSRFMNVPRNRLPAAGREVLDLRDEEIFERVE